MPCIPNKDYPQHKENWTEMLEISMCESWQTVDANFTMTTLIAISPWQHRIVGSLDADELICATSTKITLWVSQIVDNNILWRIFLPFRDMGILGGNFLWYTVDMIAIRLLSSRCLVWNLPWKVILFFRIIYYFWTNKKLNGRGESIRLSLDSNIFRVVFRAIMSNIWDW